MNRFVGGINPGSIRTNCLLEISGAPDPEGCGVPGGVAVDLLAFAALAAKPAEWAKPATGVVHVVHPLLGSPTATPWFNRQWRLQSITNSSSSTPQNRSNNKTVSLIFGEGGWQSAQGSRFGSCFFIENVRELLDAESEFFHDAESDTLYLWRNASMEAQQPKGEYTVHESVVKIVSPSGADPQQRPVRNISIRGVRIRHTSTDFLAPHEVPGGGDQSMHRGRSLHRRSSRRHHRGVPVRSH